MTALHVIAIAGWVLALYFAVIALLLIAANGPTPVAKREPTPTYKIVTTPDDDLSGTAPQKNPSRETR